jgi:hypothetical protein
MAQYIAYANFVVYFSNDADYNFAIGIAGSNSALMSPATAAATFGFVDGVNFNTGGPLDPIKGMYGFFPYGIPSTPPGVEVNHPAPSGVFLTWDVDSVLVPGQVGTFGPAGPDMLLKWSMNIVKVANSDPGAEDVAPIPRRRWICGFEGRETGEGGQGGANNKSRDCSRTLDGVGIGMRNSGNYNFDKSLDEYGAVITPTKSWERFYIRPRFNGGTDVQVWASSGAISSAAGARLFIKSDLSIDVYNVTAASAFTLVANTGPILEIDFWANLDIIVEYSTGVGVNGRIRLWVNKALLVDQAITPAMGGLGQAQNHQISRIFNPGGAANTWEIDFDTWINAEVPNILGTESLTSLDFLTGSHVKKHWIEAGTAVGYTGAIGSVNQMMNPPNVGTPTSTLVSSTALAQIVGLTDFINEQGPIGQVFCTGGILVNCYTTLASGSTAGQLGYNLAGAGVVFGSALVEGVTARFNSVLYKTNGDKIVEDSPFPLGVVYEKANTAVVATVFGLGCEVEYIGIWGREDEPETIALPNLYLTHNAWWPSIAWSFLGPVQDGPVVVEGGTYVGNGASQDIALPLPCHFLWIRPLSGGSAGVKWFGSCMASHESCNGGVKPNYIQKMNFNPTTGVTSFSIAGSDGNINANGVTYQYIAFCDPAMMFNLCGAFMHSAAVSATNPLVIGDFEPVAAFIQYDRLDNDAVVRQMYKGPGMAGALAKVADGTTKANCVTFGVGSLASGPDANATGYQTMYSLWRTGNECAYVMCQAYTYTGDGTGSRVINSTPISGRFPLLVYVQPHNGIGIVKDPSDAGTTSRQITDNSSVGAAGITAVGIDTITVASGLNANGIVYDVFILPGSTDAFENGTFFPGNCIPPEIVDPPEPPEGINILPEGGLILSGVTPLTLLLDVSGIYTIVPGKRNDTLYDRLAGQPNIDVAIPNPRFKTGYIGG